MATTTIEVVKVEMKSPWLSKINWTAAAALFATALNAFGPAFGITPEMQVQIQTGITAIASVLTILMKTFMTPTVAPASLTAATIEAATVMKVQK